jgi:amino acid transporter
MTDSLNQAPTASTPPGTVGHADLNRDLGVWSIVLMVVAAAAPMGAIAGLMPVAMSVSGSVAVPLFFLIAAAVLTLFAVGFTAMSKFVPNAGAFYSYIQAGLGRHLGTAAAALALGSYLILLVGVNAYVGVATSNVIDTYTGVAIPWWILAIASLLLVAFLGYRDIELSSKVLGLLLVAETLVLVIAGVAVVIRGGDEGLSAAPLSPSELSVGSPALGLMFAIFGFIGFEATAVFRHEARKPDVTIPRATYIAVIFIGLFYAVSSWTMIEGVGSNALATASDDPENFVLDVGGRFVGIWLQDTMQVLVVTSQFAVVLAFHNVVTRYQYTLGTKGVLPAKLGEVHPKHRAPSNSSMTASVISIVIMVAVWAVGLDPIAETYAWFSGAATLGLVVLMALTSLAVLLFFRRSGNAPSAWHGVIAPVASLIALVVVTVLVVVNFPLLVGSTSMAIVMGVALIAMFASGLAVAEFMRRTKPERYDALVDG